VLLVAVFVAATMYASACSAACLFPEGQVPVTPSKGAHHHEGTQDSNQSSHHSSDEPGCDPHGHPDSFIKATGPQQVEFALVRGLAFEGGTLSSAGTSFVISLRMRRDHAPPGSPPTDAALLQKIACLRI